MFDNMNIGVTRHAIQRFRQRIDPTATVANIIEYLKQSVPPTHVTNIMRDYGYTLCQYLRMERAVYFAYRHVTFVVARKDGKGANQIAILTCF